MAFRVGEKLGPYTLVRKLGQGGQGQVWLVEDRSGLAVGGEVGHFELTDAPQFALKVCLDLEDFPGSLLPKNLQNELNNWVKVSNKKHPNILPIIKPAIYNNLVVLISEYAPEGTLRHWLKARKNAPVPWEEAVELMAGILAGLAFLHENEIVHRDLKPENIVMQGSLPRLMDFGLSRTQVDSLNQSRAMGTPDYMPPEAFNGHRSIAWDIWAAGVLFQELLTGERPFPRTEGDSSDVMMMKAICDHAPSPLPDGIPDVLREIIALTLEKNRAVRAQNFSGAGALYEALQAARIQARLEEIPREVPSVPPIGPEVFEGYQLITNCHSDMAIDLSENSTEPGVRIHQFEVHREHNQQWQIRQVPGEDTILFLSRVNLKCIDVCENRVDAGAPVHSWGYLGGNNQKWYLEPQEDGSYCIRGKESGLYLEVAEQSRELRALIQLGVPTGASHQRWWINPA